MRIQARIESMIDKLTAGRYWLLTSAMILTAIALFFAFPSYNDIVAKDWDALFEKAAAPFENSTHGAGTHEAKITFRLLVPLVVHYTHMGIAGILVMLGIVGMLNFYMVVRLANEILKDKRSAFIIGLCSAFIYFGKCSFIELRGTIFDGLGIFFLLCALNYRKRLLLTLFVFLSAWCDERALIASSLVWLFVVREDTNGNYFKRTFNKNALFVFAAWGLYAAVRYLLATKLGLRTDTAGIGLSVLLNQINNIPMGIWSALEGLWIPVIYCLVILYRDKRYLEMLKMAGICTMILFAGLSVVDITRSVVYLFPVIFTALLIISRYISKEKQKQLLWYALILCFVYPAYYTGGKSSIWWTYPLPLQIIRFI